MYMKVIGLLCMKVWKWSCEKQTLACISHLSNVLKSKLFSHKKGSMFRVICNAYLISEWKHYHEKEPRMWIESQCLFEFQKA
jgi:hypothetical protein